MMAIDYKIYRPDRLIEVSAVGETSEREWMDLFLGIKNDPERTEGMDFLFDLREHKTVVSDKYLWAVTQRMIPIITTKMHVKWAFVTLREASKEKIEKFSLYLMKSKNIEVNVFAEFDMAVAWINKDKEDRRKEDSG
jgi:hypothetical protein